MYASVAQAFANDLEPFALKGACAPPDQRRGREPGVRSDLAARDLASLVAKRDAGIRPDL
jgi:hypothetical protein